MTADRDFKRLVRARARRTGESYSSARRALVRRVEDPMGVSRTEAGDDLVEVVVEGVRRNMEDQTVLVVFREEGGDRYLLVFVGAPEATAIAFAMQGVETMRPMTHDALKQVIDALGGRLATITIGWRAETATFTADVRVVLPDGGERRFDWRPSDAVAVAVRCEPRPAILVPGHLLVEQDRVPATGPLVADPLPSAPPTPPLSDPG